MKMIPVLAACIVLLVTEANGGSIFVANFDFDNQQGSIGEYTTSGATLNPKLITQGLATPVGIAVFGSRLFVTDYLAGTIGEYTTSGQIVNSSFITGLAQPISIAVTSSDLFVTQDNGTVGEYNLDGTVVNAQLISGLITPYGIA